MPVNRNQVSAAAIAANTNGIATSQSLAAAGALILNGSLATGGVATISAPQNVVIHSAGNDSGHSWTISGTDYGGSPLTETLVGGNAADATSVNLFATVTSITFPVATASTVIVGVSGTVYSRWLILGAQREHYQWTLRTFISVAGNGANYDIQATSDPNIMRNTGDQADDIATLLAAQTAAVTSYNTSPWMAVRLKMNVGNTGQVTLRVMESRTA